MRAKRADFAALSAACSIDQVTARILVNRGYETPEQILEYLNPPEDFGADSFLLSDMEKACKKVAEAISEEKHIRIIGDYDVDGIMSTYILHTGLVEVGANADYAIPHRIEDGYGVNPEMIDTAATDGVDLIITCDNGIAASAAIERASELGITVIVTDHHQVPFTEADGVRTQLLPAAYAVVDPQRDGDMYPFKEICGAQVAYKFMLALYQTMNLDATSIKIFFRPFAAVASICDVMPLCDENRSLVFHGLKDLSNISNPGMKALLQRCELWGNKLTVFHVGFVIGPCLNAGGRLDSASRGVELLEEKDPLKCISMAQELVTLNEQRKSMTTKGQDAALEMIKLNHMEDDKVLILHLPELHESLLGLVAGRVKETYYRPTIVFANSGDLAKGSGRSIPAYNMFEELSRHKDLMVKFGGHPMAAGLSVNIHDVDKLRTALNESCSLTDEDMLEKVYIDVPMPLAYISEHLIHELERLEPFGNGNNKPVFALKDAKIMRASYLGKEKQYLKLFIQKENGGLMEALLFREVPDFIALLEEKNGQGSFDELLKGRSTGALMDLCYYPGINEFRGNKTLQITIDKFA